MKKVIQIVIFLIFSVIILISCQNNSLPSTSTSVPQAAFPQRTITIADFSFKESMYRSLIAAFQVDQPNIEIQFVPLDDLIGDSTSRISKRQIAGLADVAILYSPPTAAEQNLFLSLDPLITVDSAFADNEFWPNLRTGCPAGLPAEFYLGLIFYDRTAFAEQGILEPTTDWDWYDFSQLAQQLTEKDGSQITRYGFLPPTLPSIIVQPLIASVLPAGNTVPESQSILNAIQWYITLSDDGYLPDWSVESNPNTLREELINNGQAAMWYGTNGELAQYQSRFGESLGVAALPAGDARTTPTNITCAAISAGTAQPEAAWQWVKFLAENMPTAVIPVQPAVAESSQYWQQFDDETAKVLRFALDHAWYNDGLDDRLTAIMEEVQTAASNGISLSDALANVEQLPTPTPPPLVESVPVAPPPPTPDGDVIVDFFGGRGDQTALESLVESFNQEHSDIQIRLHTSLATLRPGQQVFKTTDFSELFDCFFLSGATDIALYGSDHFYALDPLLALEDPSFINDFPPDFLDAFRYDGQLYGLPIVSQSHLIYYNVDLLTQLGIALPTPEWTVDNLWAAATEAAQHEEVSYGLIPFGASPLNDYGMLLAMRGVTSSALIDINSSPPIVKLDDPDFLAALEWIETLTADGIMPAPNEMNLGLYSQLEAAVQNGEVAFWTLPISDIEFPVGIVPPPIAPKPYLLTDVTGFVISKRAETPLGCWEWANFLSLQPQHILPGAPVRASVTNSDAWQNAIGTELQEANLTSLSRSHFQPFPDLLIQSPERPLRLWLLDALVTSYITNVDPVPLLAQAQSKADAYLACLSSPLDSTSEMINQCALEADPDYLTPEEAREATLEN